MVNLACGTGNCDGTNGGDALHDGCGDGKNCVAESIRAGLHFCAAPKRRCHQRRHQIFAAGFNGGTFVFLTKDTRNACPDTVQEIGDNRGSILTF